MEVPSRPLADARLLDSLGMPIAASVSEALAYQSFLCTNLVRLGADELPNATVCNK